MSGIIHCPRCGHHVNIQFGETAGYCPLCDKEVPAMEKRTIWVKPSTFAPEFEMIIPVPTDRDDEEYIDELLDGILNDEFRYNIECGGGIGRRRAGGRDSAADLINPSNQFSFHARCKSSPTFKMTDWRCGCD